MRHILHARLLIAAQKRTERVPGSHSLAKKKCASVQAKNGRAFVVDNAAAQKPTVAAHHGKRIGVPAGAGRDHIDVRDRGDLALRLAGNIRHAHIALVIGGLITKLRGDAQCTVESGARVLTKRSARLVCTFNRHRRHCHQGGNIVEDVVPYLVDVLVNALLEFFIHHAAPIQAVYNHTYQNRRTTLKLNTQSPSELRNIMRHEICSGSLMLSLVGSAGIDTNAGNPLLMRTMNIMESVAHHHGIIDSGTKLCHSVTNGFRLGITARLQPTHNGIKGRKVKEIDHLARRCLETRRRDGNLSPLPTEGNNQLAHTRKDRVIIGRHILIENPTVHRGDTHAFFKRLMTKIGKAIEERWTDQGMQIALGLSRIAALD